MHGGDGQCLVDRGSVLMKLLLMKLFIVCEEHDLQNGETGFQELVLKLLKDNQVHYIKFLRSYNQTEEP